MQKLRTIFQRIITTPQAIIWLGLLYFTANLALLYPGKMGWDSTQQYSQAVSGHFSDWHPPVMAWVWSYLRLIADGSAPLFVLHISCYWLGFITVAFVLSRLGHPRAGWYSLLVGLLPPLITFNFEILKDVSMAVTYLAAFALTFFYRAQGKKLPLPAGILIILLLLYGTLVRVNAVFALPPMLVYACWPGLFNRPFRLVIAFAAITVLTFPVSHVINYTLIRAKQEHAWRSLVVYDLAGIAYYSGDMSVFWPGMPLTEKEVRGCYSSIEWDAFGGYGKCDALWDSPSPSQTRTWAHGILKHPLAYAKHRILHYNSSLYFIVQRHHAVIPVLNHVLRGEPLRYEKTTWENTLNDYMVTEENPFFTPAFVLLMGLGCLAFLFPRSKQEMHPIATAALALDLSGIFYSVAYLIIGVASQLRYYYWSYMAFCLTAVLYIVLRRREFHPLTRTGWLCFAYAAAAAGFILFAHLICGDALAPS